MKPIGTMSAQPNPIEVPGHAVVGSTVLAWNAPGAEVIEIRVGAPDGPLFCRAETAGSARTGEWVSGGMVFYLQDVTRGLPLTPEHTLSTITVGVTTPGPTLGVILTYHRVAELSLDPWSLAVTPEHFTEHLGALRELATPWRLPEFARAAQQGHEIERAVVVTFDDGYADNLHWAKPRLERYEIPATVFVTAGFVGGEREFWWDALNCLLGAAPLPAMLNLTIDGRVHQWDLGQADPQDLLAHPHWRAAVQEASTPRQTLYGELYKLLRPLPEKEQRRAVDQLWAWAGIDAAGRTAHRQLSVDELRALTRGGLIEIGSHSMTHPHLPSLSPLLQWEEIAHSKAVLEQLLDQPVVSLSYPHGACTPETVVLVERAGYSCACASTPRAVGQHADRHQLPRVMVGDWDGAEFARRLSGFLAP